MLTLRLLFAGEGGGGGDGNYFLSIRSVVFQAKLWQDTETKRLC